MTFRFIVVVALAVALASCADYRFDGTSSCADYRFDGTSGCAPDGSVVWFEKPNSDGSYDGLQNSPDNC